MRQRCYYQKHVKYPKYGGAGITVCDRWLESFENFIADMGPAPEGHTIDRIDVNGNYEPANCRWASPKQQSRNRRPFVNTNSLKTHCPAGHPYDEENTASRPNGNRVCKECGRIRAQVKRDRLKAQHHAD